MKINVIVMKRILLSIFSVFFTITVFAQDRTECERIVGVVFDAVSKQNMEQIRPYLAENFKIAGQSSPVAETVLAQLVSNLGNIESFILTEVTGNVDLTFNYDVEYEKHGKKQALFEFDQNNRIKRMELLKIVVKTAKVDPSKIEYNLSNVIEIPFTRMGNLIVVKASVNGEEQDFILDSGSGFTIINSKYIEKDTVDTEKEETVLSTAKGVHDESLSGTNIVNMSIDFYGIRVNRKDMLTNDISHLESEGRQIYGLIGHDFLSKYDVLYDYARNVVILINPDYFETYRKEKLSKHLIETLPLEWRGHIPIMQIRIGDDYYKLGIDCGAGANLLDITLFAKVKDNLEGITTKSLGGASKNKKDVTHAQLKEFYAGTTLFKKSQTVFSDISHLNEDKGLKINGLIGYEFLSKQLTLVSYQRKELLLIK